METKTLYRDLKNALSRACQSTEYFTPETLDTIMTDRLSAAKVAASGGDTQEFLRESDTEKTDFYNKNSCAYCVLLELLAEYEKLYKICVIFPECVRAFHLQLKADSAEQAKLFAIAEAVRENPDIYGEIIAEVEKD